MTRQYSKLEIRVSLVPRLGGDDWKSRFWGLGMIAFAWRMVAVRARLIVVTMLVLFTVGRQEPLWDDCERRVKGVCLDG